MTSGSNAETRMRRNPRTEHRGAMPQPFPIDLHVWSWVYIVGTGGESSVEIPK